MCICRVHLSNGSESGRKLAISYSGLVQKGFIYVCNNQEKVIFVLGNDNNTFGPLFSTGDRHRSSAREEERDGGSAYLCEERAS